VTGVFIGLGSNLGDRLGAIAAALRELAATPGVHVLAVSHAYESEPWGVTDQPRFANAVAKLDVRGEADALLVVTKDIEQQVHVDGTRRSSACLIRASWSATSSSRRSSRSRRTSRFRTVAPSRGYTRLRDAS
jgi:7,8-dihydro-6-hydroxymethylpterin-pyrophosphokinase